MTNWCSTTYVVEGEKKELKALYDLMKGLESMDKPLVENDFGQSWLGCLVTAIGESWQDVRCRGYWAEVFFREEDKLQIETVTAWDSCNKVFKAIKGKFKSLSFYYQFEEPGTYYYGTNDKDGKYFTDRYIVDACRNTTYFFDYYSTLESALEMVSYICGKEVRSLEEAYQACDKAAMECGNPVQYCRLHEVKLYDDLL